MKKKYEIETQSMRGKRTLAIIFAAFLIVAAVTYFLPADPSDYGVMSVVPALFLIVYIFSTRRILEALILASVLGFVMVSRPVTMGNDSSWLANTFTNFSDAALATMMNEDIAFLIIVCGLMGSIIALIEKAGGAYAFGEWIASKAKTRTSSLICTWILGIVIFIDDYMNSLTVGACMTKVTDKHRVPREFLSYIVDSTAAPISVLIPVSTWAIFCGRILESTGWAPAGNGMQYFIKTIPFNFYGWVAALIVPLVILKVIPIFGPMKEAYHRVAQGGPLAPPGSEKIDIRGGKDSVVPTNPNVINMFAPILVLIVSTIVMDCDMQKGVFTTLAFMFVFYMWQGLMTEEEFFDLVLEGLKNMLMPIMLMILAFLFKEMNDQIQFTQFVIDVATSHVTPQLLPLVIFIALSITEFITGTNWGMYIIALPIVIPLAQTLGCDTTLAVSAVLSAGVFGSHVCFYSDATIITSAATGCNNFDHATTQAPYGLLGAFVSALLFLVFGFIMN